MKIIILSMVLLYSAMSFAKWSNSSEINMVKSGGNSDSSTYGLSSKTKYIVGKNVFNFSGAYNFAESNDVTSKENWNATLKYDRMLTEKLGIYIGEIVEEDRFTGFAKRYNTDLGLLYNAMKTDKSGLAFEAGYRYTINEDLAGETENYSKLRLFMKYHRDLNQNVKFAYHLEYLPNLTESSDYILSMEPQFIVVLAKELFFKVSYEWKYENTPVPGKAKADYSLKTSLLATF